MLPSVLADIIPNMTFVTTVRFTAWQEEYAFIGRGVASQVELELFRHDQESFTWGDLVRKGLMELLGFLNGVDVRRFEIAVDYSTVEEKDFEAIFKAFPNLEMLTLNGEGDFDCALQLLARDARLSCDASASSSPNGERTDTKTAGTVAGQLWRPNLKALIIGDVDEERRRDDTLLDGILQVLRMRAARGARLDRFVIRLIHDTEEGTRRRRRSTFLGFRS